MEKIKHTEEDRISELLIGRSITQVEDNTVLLDDGTVLTIAPNEGCGGCKGGWFALDVLNKVENVITSVNFVKTADTVGMEKYEIFVYTEGLVPKNGELFATVSGDVGSGYYGTGYGILVTHN